MNAESALYIVLQIHIWTSQFVNHLVTKAALTYSQHKYKGKHCKKGVKICGSLESKY